MLITRVALGIALLLVSDALTAATRIGFRVRTESGQQVSSAEICFFEAGDAANPLQLHLKSPAVKCLPADRVIEIPPGRWFYYAQREADLRISSNLGLIEQSASAKDLYHEVIEQVFPAAKVDLSLFRAELKRPQSIALYISNMGTDWLPALIPISDQTSQWIVPSGMPLVMLAWEGNSISMVSEAFTPRPGETVAVKVRRPKPDHGTVLAWIMLDEESRDSQFPWRNLPAPEVRLERDGYSIEPEIPLRAGNGSDGALLLFPNVPRGRWALTLGGLMWRRAGTSIQLESHLVSDPTPLRTVPAAAMRVSQTALEDTGVESCPSSGRSLKQQLTLATCPELSRELRPEEVALDQCRVAYRKSWDSPSEKLLGGVKPGTYLASLSLPKVGGEVRRIIELVAGGIREVFFVIPRFVVFGRVTLDGKPLRARLIFETGEATSDQSGHYRAVLSGSPRDLPIRIRGCGDEALIYTELPNGPLLENTPYDIHIRSTTVVVQVRDASTGRPVNSATVEAGVLTHPDSEGGHFVTEPLQTNSAGEVTLTNIPLRRDITICASASSYSRQCMERQQLTRRDSTATLRLRRDTLTGLIKSAAKFRGGTLYFSSPGGTILERVDVQADGSFMYRAPHAGPSHAVFISDLPLTVFPLPPAGAGPLELTIPAARVRHGEIHMDPASGRQNAWIGLRIGGRPIPQMAFTEHQARRNRQADIIGKAPVRITELLETGPIEVVLGPDPDTLPDAVDGVDIFTTPLAVSFPRAALPEDGLLRFRP